MFTVVGVEDTLLAGNDDLHLARRFISSGDSTLIWSLSQTGVVAALQNHQRTPANRLLTLTPPICVGILPSLN